MLRKITLEKKKADIFMSKKKEEKEKRKMNYISLHIKELKYSIYYSIISYILTFLSIYAHIEIVISFWISSTKERNMINIIFTNLSEAFIIYIKFALLFGLIISIPFISIIIYLYIRSGLYKFEDRIIKRFYKIYMIILPCMVFILLPNIIDYVIEYFSSYQNNRSIYYEITFIQNFRDYFEWISNIIIISIIITFCPLVYILIWIPIKNRKTKIVTLKSREYIYLFILIIIAIITPPDILSLICIYIPSIISYEIIIYTICIYNSIFKKRNQNLN